MKFLQFKLWLVIAAFLCVACGGNNTTSTAQTSSNQANTNQTNTANAATAQRELDVPYVPTHQLVVDEMLTMAEVTGDDILYDLGSGDGRIPITAAKKFGTRGVGIDLNPNRIREANANVEKAEVTDKVKFIEGDLFKENFSEATVLTLYLLPEVNMKLRPQILQMKPGTRVVSHNYDMGDWQPEKTKKITTPDGTSHTIFFWRVPEKK